VPAITIDQVRAVNWGRTDLWEVRFPGHPIPGFSDWVPATNYSRPVVSVSRKEVPSPFQVLMLPLPDAHASPVVEMDLLDSESRDVLNWCVDWARSMSSEGMQQPLMQCVRTAEFQLLDRAKNIVQSWSDLVFLLGEYKLTGNSVAEIPTVHVKLALASALIAP